MSDRTVHATLGSGAEVVRYDRAGKWYLEYGEDARQKLTVEDAASLVRRDRSAEHHAGLGGGSVFDRLVRSVD